MSMIPKLSSREKAIFLAIYESDLNQQANLVYPLPPILEQLNLKQSKRQFSVKELEAAAKHFEDLRLGGFYSKVEASGDQGHPSRFEISPRGLSVANAMLDNKQKSAVESITNWRWWIPIAGIASVATVILALFKGS